MPEAAETGATPAPRPQLDVLIPHFRDPDGLRRSLDSVAAQTWAAQPGHRLRVIVVDDGSPPAALAAAEAVCAAFRDATGWALHLDRLPTNQGRPAARNRLLDLAAAPYLAWLDAGDLWYPQKLAQQFTHLERLTAAGVDPARLWISCAYHMQHGDRLSLHRQAVEGDQLKATLLGDDLRAYLWTLLGPAQAFRIAGRFDPRLPRLQDLDYFLTFLRAGGHIAVPPGHEPLCRYEKSDIGRHAAQVADGYRLILAKHAPCIAEYPRAFRARLAHKAHMLPARFARANGQGLAAAAYLARAALVSPLDSLRMVAQSLRRTVRAPRVPTSGQARG